MDVGEKLARLDEYVRTRQMLSGVVEELGREARLDIFTASLVSVTKCFLDSCGLEASADKRLKYRRDVAQEFILLAERFKGKLREEACNEEA